MHHGSLADTFRLRDEIARSLLGEHDDRDEAADRPALSGHFTRSDDGSRTADDTPARRDRRDEVDLLTGGGLPPERR